MNPLDQIRATSKPQRKCAAGRAIAHPDHGPVIQEALHDEQCTLVAISHWAEDQGLTLPISSLSKHRLGQCACH